MGAAAREVEAGRGNVEAEIGTENGELAETDPETAKIADRDEGKLPLKCCINCNCL